ncbi:MAG: citrate synthase/methylcitrate synthase [Acidimicrobiia bacterium]|nr:citrate synthase/methylcitrate synthase [Acidimicrobiia bacterium]
MRELIEVPPGLADVAVTSTAIGDVLGDEGLYHYRGRAAPELARTSDFETVAALVLDESPEPLVGDRSLPPEVAALVGELDLRSGLSLLGVAIGAKPMIDIDPTQRRADAVRLITALPTLIASVRHGRPAEPDPDLGHVADYLRMLLGAPAPAGIVAALETYFVLTIDHGFNNSTFATRVVASTGADLAACVVAGYASLSGPRHGAAIERILDMLDAIGEPENAEEWMRAEIASRRRLQGFGHAVYRAADPRSVLMSEVGAAIAPERHRLAAAAEVAGTRLLAGRRLVANVDLHAAVVLEGCGIPRGWFGATFAAARIVGWCAHALEQATEAKIIRPAAHYVGPIPDQPVP